MKTVRKFKIGSKVFFDGIFSDYSSKDDDILCIMNSWELEGTNVINIKNNNIDGFYYRDMTKEEFIDDAMKSNTAMRVGKFIVPEFAEYLEMSIDDLKILGPKFNELDTRHEYERVIYDAYIKNASFTLTDEQRKEAYNMYVKNKKS